jgi:hypothetical protein
MKLLNLTNWLHSLVGFFTFQVGGGGSSGGGGGSQTSTSYSTNLPEYAKPYYEQLMKSTAQQVYSTDSSGNVTGVQPYSPYTGSQQAAFTPEQIATQKATLGMTTPGQFAPASAGLGAGSTLGLGAGLTGLSGAMGYTPISVGTGTFGAPAAAAYMSPYASNVTDIAVREARKQADLAKSAGALGAIGRGTFGGARQALLQSEQERGAEQNIANIRAQGQQDAYTNAQQQFNQDQARSLQAQQLNQAAYGQQAGLLGQLGTAGLQAGLQGSQALGQLGAQQQTTDLARLQAQEATGAQGQQQNQKALDIAYQNFLTQQNYPKTQLEYLSNILRGNAGALGSTQVQYTPAPSTASQIAGLGLAGLGLYNVLGKTA